MNIPYIIFLLCCAINGAMLGHFDVHLTQWEYWVCLALPITAWICGRAYGRNS